MAWTKEQTDALLGQYKHLDGRLQNIGAFFKNFRWRYGDDEGVDPDQVEALLNMVKVVAPEQKYLFRRIELWLGHLRQKAAGVDPSSKKKSSKRAPKPMVLGAHSLTASLKSALPVNRTI